jgi:hypothetical protein
MLTIAELTAAPHFPEAMRAQVGRNALAEFIQVMNSGEAVVIVEDNGELRLVSAPNS